MGRPLDPSTKETNGLSRRDLLRSGVVGVVGLALLAVGVVWGLGPRNSPPEPSTTVVQGTSTCAAV